MEKNLALPLNRIVLYVRDIEAMAAFYERHFGFRALREEGDRIVELTSSAGGANLMLHQAAKKQKPGQSSMKLVFDVEDVEAFSARCAKAGLTFGAIHRADGYVFANARDPNDNPISISSRAFRKRNTTAV